MRACSYHRTAGCYGSSECCAPAFANLRGLSRRAGG